jgi:hypothetical protein
METTMKQVILIGEIRVGDTGAVHQQDLAAVLEAERLSAWPKEGTPSVIVGRLLAGRKPALLVRAENDGVPTALVESVMTPEVCNKLVVLLEGKPKRETYEERALIFLKGIAAQQPLNPVRTPGAEPPKRRKKSKAAANG